MEAFHVCGTNSKEQPVKGLLSKTNTIIMTNKFKVGDVVVGNDLANKFYSTTIKGWKGVVTNIYDTSIDVKCLHTKQIYTVLKPYCFDLLSNDSNNKSENMYQVDAEFIKEAHSAACDSWKRKIEEKFPDAFPKDPRFKFEEVFTVDTNINSKDAPFGVILGVASEENDEYKGLVVSKEYTAIIRMEKEYQIIEFHKK